MTTPARAWQIQGMPSVTRSREEHLRLGSAYDQMWRGFGGCFNELGWVALSALRGVDRNRVMDALFDPEDGCGFNLCRVPIGASDYALEWYSHNESDGDLEMRNFSVDRDLRCLIPYIRMALERRPKLKLFASPWSPPTWMKEPRSYHGGQLLWKPEILEAYALYLARFVKAYQAEGIRIQQIHVQNDPAADGKFPSCRWSGSQLRDFIRGYLGPMFQKQRLRTEIWLGTLNTDDYNGYTLTVLADPMARQYISGVGCQGAGKAIVRPTHENWPDLPLMQTENDCGDGKNSWECAQDVFGLLQHYLSGGVSAYAYGPMVLPRGGVSPWGGAQNSLISVDPERRTFRFNPDYYVMKHFAHFIALNAVRLDLSGEWSRNAVLFLNDDDSRVLVLQNPFPESRRIVLADGSRTLSLSLQPESIHTLIL